MNWRAWINVECPSCGAHIGERCMTITGNRAVMTHTPRIVAAEGICPGCGGEGIFHRHPCPILAEAFRCAAQADRNPKGHDAEERHGAKHESPVANGDASGGRFTVRSQGLPPIEDGEMRQSLERLERQFSTCSDSYEAPNGKIMLRVWVTDLARVLKLARTASSPNLSPQGHSHD